MRPQDIKRQIKELEEASAGDKDALEGFNEKLKQTKEDIRSYQTQLNTANRTLRENSTEHEALTKKVEDLEAAFETDKAKD
jgi:septal ring factor EnvC (AmiA/AmiB activator)